MLSNKSQTFQGSKRKGASRPVTTPYIAVKLNSKVVEPNSDRKVQSTDSFFFSFFFFFFFFFFCLTLRSSLGYLYCSEVLEDCISPAS